VCARYCTGFDIEKVAAYGDEDVARLMADEGIVRNRKKIDAAITNAHAARELHTAGETLRSVGSVHGRSGESTDAVRLGRRTRGI
jgi:3-methyladenine DNA glycosylase Tag